ncbi:MAG: FG-GAP-like repeat-containing protein [Planctomycetota bacterium]
MDWTNDGKLDILSGCYWTEGADGGHLQLLAGRGGLDFAESTDLLSGEGKPLLNEALAEDKSNQTSIICVQQHAVDYDGDGDLDLVVGCFGQDFFLYENKGTAGKPDLVTTPRKLEIKSPDYHSAPHLVDWDGDGDLDLLSGSGNGGVLYSENAGTRAEPKWSEFTRLISKSEIAEQVLLDGATVQPSQSTRVWATDWNGDGLLDLLVGDSASLLTPAEGLTKEEFEQKRKEYQEAFTAVAQKQQPMMEKSMALREKGEEVPEELEKALQENMQELQKVFASQDKFQTADRTGFVWLYLQKPKPTATK